MAAAVSIGIGGMVGAGIFSILGVVAQAAGNAMWLAFAIGGVVALLSTYSYAKLGATFPSAGGAVHFLVKSFGDGVLAGGLNLFMWAGYIISLALYATAFGSYAATFVTTHAVAAAAQVAGGRRRRAAHAGQCLRRASSWGARETVIVAIKVAILVLFAAVGLWFVKPGNLSPALWPETEVDPVRRRRAVHRLRGLRARDQCGRRHAQSPDDAAARALHQRDPGDRDLSRGVADRHRQPVERTRSSTPGTTRWPRPPSRSWANSASG